MTHENVHRIRSSRRRRRLVVGALVAFAGLAVVGSTSAAPAPDASVPAFVQQVSKRALATSVALQPTTAIVSGNRLVVEVGVWSAGYAKASTVTDSAGNTYTELTHFTASDHAELSVWSAPITKGGGTRPTVTVKPSAKADIGAAVLEYSGLATDAGAAVVDQVATATATTGAAAAAVSSGPTPPTTAAGELAVGFYADSGFGATLTGDPTYATRTNVSPTSDMEFLVQDQVLGGAGTTPSPTTTTGAKIPWLAATVVFKTATPAPPPSVPDAPAAPSATAGEESATVTWTAPASGGSPITGYTVTPYAGSAAQAPTTVSGSTNSTTVSGLTDGTAYTFKVRATNAIGDSPQSAASNAVTPVQTHFATPFFVQGTSKSGTGSSVGMMTDIRMTTGDRMIVEAAVRSADNATAASVTDSAGNTYTELTHVTGSDNTELSVWSAPITTGGVKALVSVTASGSATIGATALEYSGLSTAGGSAVLDAVSTGTGTTGASAVNLVSTTATAPSTSPNALALGVYADAGLGNALSGDAAFATRANASPRADTEFLVQDKVLQSAGSTAAPAFTTGANTPWVAATLVLKAGSQSAMTRPAAPAAPTATAGNGQITVNWAAPADGGSPITSYYVRISRAVQGAYDELTSKDVQVAAGTTSVTFTGLDNGSSYIFTVEASNAYGTSYPSPFSTPVTPGTFPGGQWGPLMNWPLVAANAILMKTGNVLAFDGWQQPQPTLVWNAATQTFPTTLNAPGAISGAGNAHLPDGRVITAGGNGTFTTGNVGLADTDIFDPTTNTWSRAADMNTPRRHPSLTELADGRYVAISGNSTDGTTWADTPEVYDPKANKWTQLTGVSTPQVHEEQYPFSFLAPNGNVFTIGPEEDNSFLLDIDNKTWTQTGGASGIQNGSAVMYRPGKILYTGGAASVDAAAPSQATSAVIDLTSASPAWRQVAPMQNNRTYHTLTMLADGRVLALGGGDSGDRSVVTNGVLQAEIWDPDTETWSTAAPMAAARNYGSTAVLMPDGRVVVAGGGHYQDGTGPGQYSAQLYSPSYLYGGPRPTIQTIDAATAYGQTFTVRTDDPTIRSVNLVSLAADTHQSDMDQHFVPLSFSQVSTPTGNKLTIQAPANAALAPAGDYMVFVVNDKGVPSVASMIHVAPALSAPAAPAVPSATAGDAQATVSWTAPADGGSAITGYTVTPYIGSLAQTPKIVPATSTSTTFTGLTNGTSYTFTVKASNSVGTGAESPASNAVTPVHVGPAVPTFVQQVNKRALATSVVLQPASAVTAGDRIIVETGIWSSANATASTVTDSAGNAYTKITSFTASDHTEMSVWSAPVTGGGGTRPTITVTATRSADIGAVALEYAGLDPSAGAAAVDVLKTGTGTTGTAAAPVSSGPTPGTSAPGELAVGFYADSGFGNTLTGDAAYSTRTNVSPTGDMELFVQDKVLGGAGSTAAPATTTGKSTPWLAATVVFKTAPPTV